MRFLILFVALLFFSCSWGLDQVLAARKVSLKVLKCPANQHLCGVEVQVSKDEQEKTFAHLFPINIEFAVHKTLLLDSTDSACPSKEVNFIRGWTGQCINNFCMLVELDLNVAPDLMMNIPNYMKPDNLVPLTPSDHFDSTILTTAFPAPKSLPLPNLSYRCEKDKECTLKISDNEASISQFNLSFHRSLKKLNQVKQIIALNGVGTCFDDYCMFMEDTSLQVKWNFDGNFYVNVVREELQLNQTNQIDTMQLLDWVGKPQVTISVVFIPSYNAYTIHCKYVSGEDKTQELHPGPDVSIPLPYEYVGPNEPVHRFKVANGEGACFLSLCCFKHNDKNKKNLFVNFEGTCDRNTLPAPWYDVPASTSLVKLYPYTGVKDHAELQSYLKRKQEEENARGYREYMVYGIAGSPVIEGAQQSIKLEDADGERGSAFGPLSQPLPNASLDGQTPPSAETHVNPTNEEGQESTAMDDSDAAQTMNGQNLNKDTSEKDKASKTPSAPIEIPAKSGESNGPLKPSSVSSSSTSAPMSERPTVVQPIQHVRSQATTANESASGPDTTASSTNNGSASGNGPAQPSPEIGKPSGLMSDADPNSITDQSAVPAEKIGAPAAQDLSSTGSSSDGPKNTNHAPNLTNNQSELTKNEHELVNKIDDNPTGQDLGSGRVFTQNSFQTGQQQVLKHDSDIPGGRREQKSSLAHEGRINGHDEEIKGRHNTPDTSDTLGRSSPGGPAKTEGSNLTTKVVVATKRTPRVTPHVEPTQEQKKDSDANKQVRNPTPNNESDNSNSSTRTNASYLKLYVMVVLLFLLMVQA